VLSEFGLTFLIVKYLHDVFSIDLIWQIIGTIGIIQWLIKSLLIMLNRPALLHQFNSSFLHVGHATLRSVIHDSYLDV